MSQAPIITTPPHGASWLDTTREIHQLRKFDAPTGEWVTEHEFEWREHKRLERRRG